MKDLVVVVADNYQEVVIRALLQRVPFSSGTRPFSFDVIRNIGNDPGSYNDSHELLRPYSNEYQFALVVFDYEGTGVEMQKSREQVESHVESLLNKNGWNKKSAVIVIKPELETWMWQDNPNVENAIGWEGLQSLYQWAETTGKIPYGEHKPPRPKETLEDALRKNGTPKSAAIYRKIAETVSYKNCTDPAFTKAIRTLKGWFPAET